MNSLLITLLGALVTTNQIVVVSNLMSKAAGVPVPIGNPNDPVEKEYTKLLEDDDAAQTEVDGWIQENQTFQAKGAGLSREALNSRIKQRFSVILEEYQDFLKRHPDHPRALLAYGSFLNDTGDEIGAVAQWEKARDLAPNNPATWNNLANYYGHRGPVKKAFSYYTKAIELNPSEAVYYQNFATTLFLFRKDAMEMYDIDEQKVFDRALELYEKALKRDPDNFPLATDVAQTYYGIKPPRPMEALAAWNYALKVAKDQVEREGIFLHLARVELGTGHFAEARQHLNSVTNQMYTDLKQRLVRNLLKKEGESSKTHGPPVNAADRN